MFSRPHNEYTAEPRSIDSVLLQDINRCLQGRPVENNEAKGVKNIRCVYCSSKERVQTFHDLHKGDHISLLGEHGKFNISNRQFAFYKHHAIVKCVKPLDDGSSAVLALIQFISTPLSESIRIQQTEEIKHLYNDEIYKYRYRHQTNSPDVIIERAEQIVKESKNKKYCIFHNNCEHFARWCVVGLNKCLQVENIFEKIKSWANKVGGWVGRIYRFILEVTKLIPEDVFVIAKPSVSIGASLTLLLGAAFINLLFTIHNHYKLSKELDKGEICKVCCSRKKTELWIEYIAYLITNGGGFLLLILTTIKWVTSLIFIGTILFSLFGMYLLPKLWNMFKGPFRGQQIEISSLDEIQKADIITIHHWKLKHDCIVSSIKIENTMGAEKKKGKLKIIHYALPSLASRRRIVEEEIYIDLTKERVWVHDYSDYSVFEPDEVIRRAKLRVGETKFKVLSNRSPHFCYWAKVNEKSYEKNDTRHTFCNELHYEKPFVHENENKNLRVVFIDHRKDKILSSCKNCIYEARTNEDIRAGDLIEFKYRRLSHKAICTNAISREKPSEVKISIIHYGDSYTVVEEDVMFDLNHESIKVHNYHPIHRFKREDIIKRARAKVGEKKYNIFTNRASHFAENNVCKSKNLSITSLNDIVPGDAFIYRYWGLPHEALLTNITIDECNNATTGTIEFVHYGLEHIFATREIVVETQFVNVLKTKLQRKSFEGYSTYQNETAVIRAKSRNGELRFNSLHNKSSDFVFWCKVIQEPSIFVLKSPTQLTTMDIIERFVVVPEIGKVQGQFQENWIRTWSELSTGSVIKVHRKRGILEDKDEASSTIRFICYNKSKNQIEHKQFNIDLKKNKARIFIYWCDPRKSYSPRNVILRAENTSNHPQFNSELDFCKYCVIKELAENVD